MPVRASSSSTMRPHTHRLFLTTAWALRYNGLEDVYGFSESQFRAWILQGYFPAVSAYECCCHAGASLLEWSGILQQNGTRCVRRFHTIRAGPKACGDEACVDSYDVMTKAIMSPLLCSSPMFLDRLEASTRRFWHEASIRILEEVIIPLMVLMCFQWSFPRYM